MRRNSTSVLIAALLAAATWACDDQTLTSPTPLAAVSADGLAASTTAAPSAATSLTAIQPSGAKGGKPGKPDKPKPPPDDEPPAPGGTALYMATVTFGGETSTATTPMPVDVGDDALHVAFSAFALPVGFVTALVEAKCFDALSPQPTAWFHISETNTGLSNSNRFNARLGRKDEVTVQGVRRFGRSDATG